jgi:hypothetical protein
LNLAANISNHNIIQGGPQVARIIKNVVDQENLKKTEVLSANQHKIPAKQRKLVAAAVKKYLHTEDMTTTTKKSTAPNPYLLRDAKGAIVMPVRIEGPRRQPPLLSYRVLERMTVSKQGQYLGDRASRLFFETEQLRNRKSNKAKNDQRLRDLGNARRRCRRLSDRARELNHNWWVKGGSETSS